MHQTTVKDSRVWTSDQDSTPQWDNTLTARRTTATSGNGRVASCQPYSRRLPRLSQLTEYSMLRQDRVRPRRWHLPKVGPSGLVVGVRHLVGDAQRSQEQVCRFEIPARRDGWSALPFADATFDSVICQLGLMFFPDPARGLAEFRRVLRPHHRAVVCVISTRERAPMWGVLAEILSRYLPEQQEVLHSSFALADAGRLERLLATAGFREISVTRRPVRAALGRSTTIRAPIEEGVVVCHRLTSRCLTEFTGGTGGSTGTAGAIRVQWTARH